MSIFKTCVIGLLFFSKVIFGNDFKCSSSDGAIRIQSPEIYQNFPNEVVYENLRGAYRIVHIVNGRRQTNLFFSDRDLQLFPQDVPFYHMEKDSLIVDMARDLKINESTINGIKNDNRVLVRNGDYESHLLYNLSALASLSSESDSIIKSVATYKDPYGNLTLAEKYRISLSNLKSLEVKELGTDHSVMTLAINPKANIARFFTKTDYETGYGDGRVIFNAIFSFQELGIDAARVTCTYNWSWI